MRKTLNSGIDSIFREVKTANDNDSSFVNGEHYSSLINVLERFLQDLDKLIQNHYSNFEIKEAEIKHKQLKIFEKADEVKKHVERENLDALAILKKKGMISRHWLGTGDLRTAMAKVHGFRDADPIKYEELVGEFMLPFVTDIQRLCIVETKKDVLELEQLVFQLPVFATILDSEKMVFVGYWNNIWNAFFESTPKKLRLATCASAQEKLDFSYSISFLQAARKVCNRVLTPVPPTQDIDDLLCLPFHNTQVEELSAQLDKCLAIWM